MQIAKDTVVQFHYVLSEADGEQVESSYETDPMAYLHGHGNLFPKLEEALEGLEAGAKADVTLTADESYGQREEGRTQRVPIKHLLTKGKLRPGMTVKVNTERGAADATVVKVGLKNVDLDTNHPLAGKSIRFEVEIVEVRDATAEEIQHGHAHGVGGHQH
ncbi:FKBP-type peptidyl-prolyl cis-trans isomerase [Marinobacterium jannaschii]|uniref:FKBP-type peptidyl-prolyl cis-trans isomerase n=1 Tax=Marinobacterium jannaschii TaxID=64970 RepID=UPI000482C0EE|nr:peptidylprolyl isomerase [Marinobacterium jannaschii]